MKRALLAAALALGLACPAFAAAPAVRVEVEPLWRLAPDGSGAGWLAYELGASKALDARFYADRSPEAKGLAARKAAGMRVPVAALKKLAAGFASDVASLWPGAERQFGTLPIERVELWYAMDDRASVLVTVGGVRTWAVNARHLGDGADPLRARLALASELFRLVSAPEPGAIEPDSLARRLQVEGLRAEALHRLVPAASIERVLELPTAAKASILAERKATARRVLAVLDGADDPALRAQLFSRDAGLSGRYLAALLAGQMGPAESLPTLARLPSSDYVFRVRPMLESWAALSESWQPAPSP